MKLIINTLILFLLSYNAFSQNGKILEQNKISLLFNENLRDRIQDKNSAGFSFNNEFSYLSKVILEEITYKSDGNKVKGYLVYPKKKGNYPAIIYNRGGNLDFAFIKAQVPHRLVLFEGGDHGLNEFDDELDEMVKQWFDKYLKEGKKLPDLAPHGR